jgi:hypothetical protein
MEDQAQSHDPRRLFYSDLKDDNLLDCIVSKVNIVPVSQSVGTFNYTFSCIGLMILLCMKSRFSIFATDK